MDQQFDTSDPAGLLTLHILGSFAQFERELLVERIKESHLHRLRKGDWSCGPVPFGYREEDGKLAEVPDEAGVVRQIFRIFLKVRTYKGVARKLSEEGVLAPGGSQWYGNTVKGILTNPVYAGANVYGRHKSGDTRLKNPDVWTVVPGVREPLVEPGIFEAAQKLIESSPVRSRPGPNENHPLTGLLRCSKCGGPMCGHTKLRGDKVHRYYVCSRSGHRGKDYCEGTSVNAEKLEVGWQHGEHNMHGAAVASVRVKEAPPETFGMRTQYRKNTGSVTIISTGWLNCSSGMNYARSARRSLRHACITCGKADKRRTALWHRRGYETGS